MPAFILAVRQYNEHKEYMESSDRLKEYIEKLWDNAIESKVAPEELMSESRALQDEIYDRRRRSPLIFDWVYRHLRNSHDEQMNRGAQELIDEAISHGIKWMMSVLFPITGVTDTYSAGSHEKGAVQAIADGIYMRLQALKARLLSITTTSGVNCRWR